MLLIASQPSSYGTYYLLFKKGQGFIPPEEWDQFISIMKEDLPATFRITGSRSLAEHVLKCLQKKFFSQLSQLEVEGEVVPPPKPIPWWVSVNELVSKDRGKVGKRNEKGFSSCRYPHNLAWHVSLTRKFIRKSPLVSKFHAFLVHENEQVGAEDQLGATRLVLSRLHGK